MPADASIISGADAAEMMIMIQHDHEPRDVHHGHQHLTLATFIGSLPWEEASEVRSCGVAGIDGRRSESWSNHTKRDVKEGWRGYIGSV
jgi:hypothetical protein